MELGTGFAPPLRRTRQVDRAEFWGTFRNCSRRPAGGASAKSESERALARLDDLAQLLDGGSFGFRVIVVAPGDEFQHLGTDVALAALHGIEAAQGAPVFLVEHPGFGRGAVPVAIKDVEPA